MLLWAQFGLAQISDRNSAGKWSVPDSSGDQGSAIPNPSRPDPATAAKNPANQRQPTSVNPFTGMTSASAVSYQPLTGRERWTLYWKQNYLSVGSYFGPFFTTIFDETMGSPDDWGSGFRGFGYRLGSRIAVSTIQGTLQASTAAVLQEDVRYITSSATGFKKRALHAIAFSFLTYNPQGHTTLNLANLASYYGATAVSTSWMPIRRGAGTYIFANGTEQIAFSVPMNLLQEFWPEIRHKLLRRP